MTDLSVSPLNYQWLKYQTNTIILILDSESNQNNLTDNYWKMLKSAKTVRNFWSVMSWLTYLYKFCLIYLNFVLYWDIHLKISMEWTLTRELTHTQSIIICHALRSVSHSICILFSQVAYGKMFVLHNWF